jgi:hypothetical protein
LRTLLWIVTGCAVLLAAMHWLELSPLVVGGLLFLAAAIGLHVVGNAIGTRLRQIGDGPDILSLDCDEPVRRQPRPEDFAPATRLSVKQSLGWIIAAATLAGSAAGGIGGGVWTAVASRGPLSFFNIFVGIIAFAALGGLAAFGTAALVQVLGGAIWQAMHASHGDRNAGPPI